MPLYGQNSIGYRYGDLFYPIHVGFKERKVDVKPQRANAGNLKEREIEGLTFFFFIY